MRPVLLTALAVSGAATLAAQQRAISDSDLFAFRWVASPQISPDGRQAVYVLVTVNAKYDGYETSLWLVATDGASPPRRLTAGPKDGGPRWSPDGTTLAFLRSKDGRPQLQLLPLAGGEARQLTDLPKGASPAAWSPDGKTIAFTSTTTPEDLAKKGKSEEPKSDVRIITQAEFRGDDEGYFDPAEHTHIWTVQMCVCSAGSKYPSSSPRNSACVMIRTSLFGSSLLPFLARSSGVVVLVKAIVLPSGDHAAGDAPLRRSVSCRASPPANGSRWSCGRPSLERRNASVVPSGDQRGPPSLGPAVSRRGGDAPSVATSQRLVS